MSFRVSYPAISMLVMVGALSAAIPPATIAEAQGAAGRTGGFGGHPLSHRQQSMG